MKKEDGIIGVLICIIIIILLIFTVAGMYYYYNYLKKSDNNQIEELENNIIKALQNEKKEIINSINTIKIEEGFNSLNKNIELNDFDLVYNGLLKGFEELSTNEQNYIRGTVNSITIMSNDIQNVNNIPEQYKNGNIIYR